MKRNKTGSNLPVIVSSDLPIVSNEDLPSVILGQVQKLNELDEYVKKALLDAEKAKTAAEKAQRKEVTFWGGRKEAIEELQKTGLSIADAVVFNAKAQKVSLEFQAKLAEVTKYLFGLGISSIAANRIVVRELELRLNGASKEELTDLARKEMLMVVKQLKDQEDILSKQEKLAISVKSNNKKIKSQVEMHKILENELQNMIEAVKKHESKIGIIVKDIRKQTYQLNELITKYGISDEQINILMKKEKHYGENLDILLKKCDIYDVTFDEMTRNNDIYRHNMTKKLFIAFAIGGLGVLLGLTILIVLLIQ